MLYRKDAVSMAVAGLLATCGFAMADTTQMKTSSLSLDPSVIHADIDAAPSTPLMVGLDKIGAAKPLTNLGLNLYGWVEAGYTVNLRRHGNETPLVPGPFNHEYGNHVMLNQVVLRLEKLVDSKKWDVGGAIDLMYGSDAARIHSSGLGYNGSDPTDDHNPGDDAASLNNFHPIWQFDVPQAYIDVNVPVGNGLKVRAGKFYTLVGYETTDPNGNQLYSHSFIFSAEPLTHTGVVGFYQLNDQISLAAGITRGWDQATEDTNGAPDLIGQVGYKLNQQWQFYVNYTVGPENAGDNGHYRTLINPIAVWQMTDKLKFAGEGLYVYDGGRNGGGYGDVWGLALYGSYTINDMFTLNARAEKFHDFASTFSSYSSGTTNNNSEEFTGNNFSFGNGFGTTSLNYYELTVGVAIKPMPKDPILQNLTIRPEIRYDLSEDHVFSVGRSEAFRDQWTVGADVIFKF
jgi:hypothetical protein